MGKTENWKDVPGYEGLYQVSDFGKIRSFYFDKLNRSLSNNTKPIKPFLNDGYPQVRLYKNGTKQDYKVHYLVMLSFVCDRPDGMQVGHTNAIRTDNRLINLSWVTPSENSRHAHYVTKTMPFTGGEKNSASKLKNKDVINIRKLKTNGLSNAEIAKIFKVTRQNINFICKKETWTHLL